MTAIEQLKALREAAKATPTEAKAEFQPLSVAAVADKDRTGYFSNREYISRSDLLRCEGTHSDPPSSVFRMGSMFDMFFTEPQLFNSAEVSDWELLQLLKSKQAAREAGLLPESYWAWHDKVVAGAATKAPAEIKLQREIYRNKLQVSEGVTIKAKCKLDYLVGKQIIDLKSTTKLDRLTFEKDIKNHKLDLQAAFYTDVAKAESFTLLVVSYVNPHMLQKALAGSIAAIKAVSGPSNAWVYRFNESEIEAGREKYRRLALAGIEKGIINNNHF